MKRLIYSTVLGLALTGAALWAQADTQGAKQEMKQAGHDVKDAAKSTGRTTKKTAKKGARKVKHGAHKAAEAVEDKTK